MKPELFETSSADEEDIRLMCRAREGDVEAFSLLYDRHRPRVANFLYRLFWDRERADDGAQEVFLKLWTARGRYRSRARFTTFLYQIAHNHWIDEVRKQRCRPEEVELAEELDSGGHGPIPVAPAADEPQRQLFLRYRQWRVREAIAGLPETYRAAFVLAHLEDRRIAEIAEVLGIPEGTVKSRIHVAVRMLRVRLASEEKDEEERP